MDQKWYVCGQELNSVFLAWKWPFFGRKIVKSHIGILQFDTQLVTICIFGMIIHRLYLLDSKIDRFAYNCMKGVYFVVLGMHMVCVVQELSNVVCFCIKMATISMYWTGNVSKHCNFLARNLIVTFCPFFRTIVKCGCYGQEWSHFGLK